MRRGGVTTSSATRQRRLPNTRATSPPPRRGVKLTPRPVNPKLSYNASATFQWHEIDPRIGGVPNPRSITTGTVRTNLSWQPTPNDFFQLNANYAGRQLLPQGYRESGPVLNLGYRRKVNDRLSLLVTAQDVLDSARQEIVFETPDLRDRLEQRGPGRIVFFGIAYNLQGTTGRQRQEPGSNSSSPAQARRRNDRRTQQTSKPGLSGEETTRPGRSRPRSSDAAGAGSAAWSRW